MGKTLAEIQQGYETGAYKATIVIPDKLPDNHVFNEDITVRENIEMLERQRRTDCKQSRTEITSSRECRSSSKKTSRTGSLTSFVQRVQSLISP